MQENDSQEACKIVARDLRYILVKGVLETKSINSPSFSDIAHEMLNVNHFYRDVLGEEFVKKQILVPLYKQMPFGKTQVFYKKGPFDKKCDLSDQPMDFKIPLYSQTQSDINASFQKHNKETYQLYYEDFYSSNDSSCNIL